MGNSCSPGWLKLAPGYGYGFSKLHKIKANDTLSGEITLLHFHFYFALQCKPALKKRICCFRRGSLFRRVSLPGK